MARRILCLLPLAVLLATACADQTSLGPSTPDENALSASSHVIELSKKGGTGGSAGKLKDAKR